MKIGLRPEEKVLKKGRANHYLRHLLMTGVLYVTNQRLYFGTHHLNFRRYELSVPLEDIADVELKNHLRVFPHGIKIYLTSGQKHHMAVWGRRRWKQAIDSARTRVTNLGHINADAR